MSATCDLLLANGMIVDGTGAPPVAGGVAIAGEHIVAVGDCADWDARERIDVGGRAICPGFIDAHAHDDQLLFDDPAMRAKVSQGVTTVVVGNCGVSLAPLTRNDVPPPLTEMAGAFRFATFGAYLDALEATPAAVNAACLVGHTTLRVATMAALDRAATADEAAAMLEHCREALAAGAIGLSSGLFYAPANAAPWTEVADLVKEVGAVGGIYTAHLRDEGDHVITAIDEACAIAAHGGAPLIVSHHKVMGDANFGRSRETLSHLDTVGATQPVGFDVYPYTAGASLLSAKLAAIAGRTIVAWSKQRPDAAGRDLAELADEMGLAVPEAVAALEPGGAVYFLMNEDDVRAILSHPNAMIGSDGIANEFPHPRLWGTFPRVLGHYSRDLGIFPFEDAVRRMTGLPAARFGLKGRGVLAPGNFADIVVVDPETIADTATFEAPTGQSIGITSVLVNGREVWRKGAPTGARPGQVLRRGGSREATAAVPGTG